jgi:hypothetical protein
MLQELMAKEEGRRKPVFGEEYVVTNLSQFLQDRRDSIY